MRLSQRIKEVSNLPTTDLVLALTGEPVGLGSTRKVFEVKDFPRYVVKIEMGTYNWQNILEWENWQMWRDYEPVAKYLAPCRFISKYGDVIIQDRVKHEGQYPEKLPEFLTDIKKTNFGFIGKKFVCCDYATIMVNPRMRQRKIKWKETTLST